MYVRTAVEESRSLAPVGRHLLSEVLKQRLKLSLKVKVHSAPPFGQKWGWGEVGEGKEERKTERGKEEGRLY